MASSNPHHKIKDPVDDSFAGFFADAYYNATGWRVYLFMLAFLVFITFVCTRVALLNILAYEFAALIGLIVCHFSAVLVIREISRLKPVLANRSPFSPGPHPRLAVWGVVLGSLAASGWLMLLPLIELVILDMVFGIRNCDPITGLGFYLTIPLISSYFTASLAAFAAMSASTRRGAGWLYVIIVAIFIVRIIIRLANGHTIGMHDPYIGSLNLPLYEHEANLNSGYLFSRAFVLIGSTFLIVSSVMFADSRFQKFRLSNIFTNLRKHDLYLPEIQAFYVLGVVIIAGFYFQGPLGMEVTRNYLEHRLDGQAETEHYRIRYPFGGEVQEDIDRIAEEMEYYYWSIVNDIGVAPDGIIRAYIYPDRRTKTFLTGVGPGVYAKPWTGEIHVEYNRRRIRALEHELVHVISGPMGVPFFGSSLLGAYGEGIAEGVQWETENDLTYHQWAAALREAEDPLSGNSFFPSDTGPLRLLTRNFRPGGFYVGRISMNYYLAASHTRWMLDTYGIDAYRAAYIRDDTVSAIGMSQSDESQAWMEYLDHVPLTETEIAYARLAFSPPKFTVRVCAHELAEHERLAGEYMAQQQWMNALDEYAILLDFSPGNMRYGYQQAKMLYYAEEYEQALNYIALLRSWESSEGWESYLYLLEGDVQARSGDMTMAREAYVNAYESALASSVKQTCTLRLEILDSPAMEDFLAAFDDEENSRWRYERARGVDESWLPYYYLGVDLVNDRKYEESEEMLLECIQLDPPHSFIRRSCLYYLGVCAYRAEEYSLARRNFEDAGVVAADIFLEEHPAYDGFIPLNRIDSWSNACADWINRCNWREGWAGIEGNGEE